MCMLLVFLCGGSFNIHSHSSVMRTKFPCEGCVVESIVSVRSRCVYRQSGSNSIMETNSILCLPTFLFLFIYLFIYYFIFCLFVLFCMISFLFIFPE